MQLNFISLNGVLSTFAWSSGAAAEVAGVVDPAVENAHRRGGGTISPINT